MSLTLRTGKNTISSIIVITTSFLVLLLCFHLTTGSASTTTADVKSSKDHTSFASEHTKLHYEGMNSTDMKDKLKERCISEISNGLIQDAIKTFYEIEDNSTLDDIVNVAYLDHGKWKNVMNIGSFTLELEDDSLIVAGVKALLNNVFYNSELFGLEILAVANISAKVDSRINETCLENETIATLNVIRQNVARQVNSLINNWGYHIINGNHDEILNQIGTECNPHVDDYLSRVVEAAFANRSKNVPDILKFIPRLPHGEQFIDGTEALIQLLKDGDMYEDFVFPIAHMIKEKQSTNNKSDCCTSGCYAQLTTRLIKQLPTDVTPIIWKGKRCKITYNDNYLYALDILYDETRQNRQIVTSVTLTGTAYQWDLEYLPDKNQFKIKNSHYNEYLFASDHYFFKYFYTFYRRVHTRSALNEEDDYYWRINMIKNASLFNITLARFDERLFEGWADGGNFDISYIALTHRNFSNSQIDHKWRISC